MRPTPALKTTLFQKKRKYWCKDFTDWTFFFFRGLCSELKHNIDALNTKVDAIQSAKIAAEALPTTMEDTDFDLVFTGLESELEEQLVKLFRRLALPFKKANRRLRDMEDIGRQLESTMGEIRYDFK